MNSLTGSFPSRLGFRGTEDVGGDLKANFALEMGIAPDSGVSNQGRLFGRQAWVGLSGSWGSLSLGRQYTMLYWAIPDSDVLGPSTQSLANFDPYVPNPRTDNSIAYRGKFQGVEVGATYSLGRDAVNAGPSPSGMNCAGESATDSKACRGWSAMVKYDRDTWGVAAAVDEFRGGPGAFAGLTSSAMKDRRTTINGYFRPLPALKVGAGVIRRQNGASAATPRSDLTFVGVTYAVSPAITLDAQFIRFGLKSSPDDAKDLVLRATYALSRRTALYTSVSRVANDGAANFSAAGGSPGGNPPPGTNQDAFAVGVRHIF
jgi:predicted porin